MRQPKKSRFPIQLKAKWTPELSADLEQMHVSSTAETLMQTMSRMIQKEVDAEILESLRKVLIEEEKFDQLDEIDKLMVKAGYSVPHWEKIKPRE